MRRERDAAFLKGEKPDFLTETASVRSGDWKVAPIPADLMDRRVEITGPTSAKMVINALNSGRSNGPVMCGREISAVMGCPFALSLAFTSAAHAYTQLIADPSNTFCVGASCFMADFEDANSPTWNNQLDGQIALRDANKKTLQWTSPEGKGYKLNKDSETVLLVRPRGWHLNERHLLIDGNPCSGGIFDLGLYLFHNHEQLKANGTGTSPHSRTHNAIWKTHTLTFTHGRPLLLPS